VQHDDQFFHLWKMHGHGAEANESFCSIYEHEPNAVEQVV
jgi:hypothetical protein